MSDITRIAKNFGLIKSVYNNILSEGITSKDDSKKKVFKEYVNNVKKNDILKNQFLVYTNIENKVQTDIAKATLFVKENIDIFSKYSKKEILEANSSIIKDILFEQEIVDDRTDLYENISVLIFTNKTPENIDKIVEATSNVVDYIINNKIKVINEIYELPNSMLSTMMVDKYNEKYSSLDESEKKMLKVLIESTDEEKQKLYTETLRECIDMIDGKLNTDDLNIKDKLLKVKDKLLNDKKEINEDFNTNISKLFELRNNLK